VVKGNNRKWDSISPYFYRNRWLRQPTFSLSPQRSLFGDRKRAFYSACRVISDNCSSAYFGEGRINLSVIFGLCAREQGENRAVQSSMIVMCLLVAQSTGFCLQIMMDDGE